MRFAAALLALPLLALAGSPAWAADSLAAVTSASVAADVEICAASQPEDVKEVICYKPGGAVTGDTFIQAAVDRQFRLLDARVVAYLAALKSGVTAQPVEFAHSVMSCFDDGAPPGVPATCLDTAADGSSRNLTAAYQAACDRTPALAAGAIALWNKSHTGSTVVLRSDGHIASVLSGEKAADGGTSCKSLKEAKIGAYKAVANLLARDALQAGYDRARQVFVAKISAQYVNLLQRLQRLVSKLDLINDKWKTRTKKTYQ